MITKVGQVLNVILDIKISEITMYKHKSCTTFGCYTEGENYSESMSYILSVYEKSYFSNLFKTTPNTLFYMKNCCGNICRSCVTNA